MKAFLTNLWRLTVTYFTISFWFSLERYFFGTYNLTSFDYTTSPLRRRYSPLEKSPYLNMYSSLSKFTSYAELRAIGTRWSTSYII